MIKKIFLSLFLLCLAVLCNSGLWAQPEQTPQRKVVVQSWGSRAVVTAWEKQADQWKEVFRSQEGYVGRNGVSSQKQEGDGATPLGEFEVRRAFGVAAAPATLLEYTQVQAGDVWVDDSASAYYNQFVRSGTADKDWLSAEDLPSQPVAYKYAIVVEYNTQPAVPGKGSAIFFHCSLDRPTAGCISVPEEDMKKFLEFLRPGDKIIIEEGH